MDMLYSRYSNPLDLMNNYINQGRFGEFVSGFCKAEYDRKKEEADKELEAKLWMAYVHSHSELSYREWKSKVCQSTGERRTAARGGDESLDDEGITAIVESLFPKKSSQRGDA